MSPARACMLDYARRHWLPEPDFDTVLGKGFYGTVFATSDPKRVVKMTKDHDEGLLMAAQMSWGLLGVVPCSGALHMPGDRWVLWKETLDHVGVLAWVEKGVEDFIPAWRDLTRMIEDRDPDLGKDPVDALYDMAEACPALRDICETCVGLYDAYGKIPGDMHEGNFGCWDNYDQLILFDAQMGALREKIDYESCKDKTDV